LGVGAAAALGQRRERRKGRRPRLRKKREKIEGTWPVPCLRLNGYMAPCIYSPRGLSLQAIETDLDLTYGGGTTVPVGTIHVRPALGLVRSLSPCLGPRCWAYH
jgi:hypothetical protein